MQNPRATNLTDVLWCLLLGGLAIANALIAAVWGFLIVGVILYVLLAI